MQSHDDADSHNTLDALRKAAKRLNDLGENLITAGAPGEPLLYERDVSGIHVRQLPSDPFALRISIGEANIHDSAYLVFRGDRDKITSLLRRALHALEAAPR